jgi:hypothetical protein
MSWPRFSRRRSTDAGGRLPALTAAARASAVSTELQRRRKGRHASALALACAVVLAPAQSPVETLRATGGLPAHIAGQFEDPVGFAQARSGEFVVLDRRAHTVYAVDAKKTAARKVLEVGFETGRVLQPAVLALSRDDIFAVADAPNGFERIQYFTLRGSFLGGFYLQTRLAPRVVIGPLVLNGVGSMSFTGKTFLVSRPESGALFAELDNSGAVVRQVGSLRPTGHEDDRDLHVAMNTGLALRHPDGGFYYVFQTGVPAFRKYDADGRLVFERHIEGVELDPQIQTLPTTWQARKTESGTYPIVPPLVRTAGVDASGRLWVSLIPPFTYVYDARGEKIRTVQFRGADVISPRTMSFTPDGRVLVTPGCYEFELK